MRNSKDYKEVNGDLDFKRSFSKSRDIAARSSLYYLDKNVLGFREMIHEPHEIVCDLAQGLLTSTTKERILFMLSRSSFKTTTISVGLPIYCLLNDPNYRILLGGQERGYSIDILTQVKGQMEENEALIAINGKPFKSSRGWKEWSIYVNGRTDWKAKEPSIDTCGIDSVKAGPKFPLVILDDPESETNTNSVEAIGKLIDQYKYFSPMLLTSPPGHMVVIGTPYSLDGLYFYILNTPAERRHFDVVIGQARKETSILQIPGNFTHLPSGPEGSLLMPDILTPEKLDNEEAKDPTFFASQYLIAFIAGAGQMFDHTWFKYYTKDQLPEQLRCYIAVDPGYSKAATAAYTSIIVAGIDNLNNIFILELVHDRLDPGQITDHLYRLYDKYQPFTIGVEMNAIQTVFGWIFQKEAAVRGILPIMPLRVRSASKEERIKGLVAPYKDGKIYHLAKDKESVEGRKVHQSQQVLESQLVRFPASKLKVDAIDAESMLLEVIDVYFQPKKKKVKTHHYIPLDSTTGY